MSEDKISQINRGKHSQLALDFVSPVFEDEKKKLLVDLKNLYRTGKATESNLLAVASGLCTIDDIEFRLKRLINQGNKAAEEMINGRKGRD